MGSYSVLAAWEFWHAEEPLVSRPAAVGCLVINALVFFVHTPVILLSSLPEGAQPLDGSWFIFIALQGLIHNIASAFLLLVMAKERVELRYKTASRIDPLTGVFNRRSFVDSTMQLIMTTRDKGSTIALILFDLDHFKEINDRLGHPCGDEILKLFCFVASSHLRPGDVFGRLGGEEFAALLPDTDKTSVRKVASRILAAFEKAGQAFVQERVRTTVSAGIAVSGKGPTSFDCLFTAADSSLYTAKEAGRNRVAEDVLSLTVMRNSQPQLPAT